MSRLLETTVGKEARTIHALHKNLVDSYKFGLEPECYTAAILICLVFVVYSWICVFVHQQVAVEVVICNKSMTCSVDQINEFRKRL